MSLRWNGIFTSGIARLLVFFPFAVLPVFSQTQTRTIEWPQASPYNTKSASAPGAHTTDRTDEIEIAGIVVEGRPINIGEPFPASDDWLKNIGFRVKNVSGKQLTRIQIQLVLPEMSEGSPQIPFCYGCDPIEKQKGVTPGEEVELTIPVGGVYPWVKSRITEKGSLSRISKAQILVVFVGLADGTVWSSRCAKTADQKNACPSPSP
jgi:hypothetical protein